MNLFYPVFLTLILSMIVIGSIHGAETEESQARQQKCEFEAQIVKTVRLNYLLFLPDGYDENAEKKWPFILFLHGAGERGDDLERVKFHGPPKLIEQGKELPFIIASPQCPESSWWTTENEALNALLDELVTKYSIDEDRIYLTGLSMGGFGTWSLAVTYPERFAAIAPICGGGDPKKANALKDIPIWVFHGAKDEVVSPEKSEEMVNALKEAGGDVQYTVYPEADHDSWTETYNNPKLYEWFLKHKREK